MCCPLITLILTQLLNNFIVKTFITRDAGAILRASHTNLYEVLPGEERQANMLHQMRHMFLSHVLIVSDPCDDRLEHLHTHKQAISIMPHSRSGCSAEHHVLALASKSLQFQVILTALLCCLQLPRQPGQLWITLLQDACCCSNNAAKHHGTVGCVLNLLNR